MVLQASQQTQVWTETKGDTEIWLVLSEVIPKVVGVGSSGGDLQVYVINTWNHEQTNEGKNACSGDLVRTSYITGKGEPRQIYELSTARRDSSGP